MAIQNVLIFGIILCPCMCLDHIFGLFRTFKHSSANSSNNCNQQVDLENFELSSLVSVLDVCLVLEMGVDFNV